MSNSTLDKAKENVPNFSMLKWLSFGNGLLRPACASFRDSVAKGEFYDNGFDELNKFLSPEAGRIAMQETIMQFLVKFCGYTQAESDTVRRAIAKKKGTEDLIPEIEERFIKYSSEHYDITEERCVEVIKPFMQIILDASSYGFSWNHSDAYSCLGYISGYLRYYYPLEFLTSALNTFEDDTEKTSQIIKYANRNNIKITMPKWRISKGSYSYDKDRNTISKGLSSVKGLGKKISRELFKLYDSFNGDTFMELLDDLINKTSINTAQIDVLIKLDFFTDFGNQRELLRIAEIYFDFFKKGKAKKINIDKIKGTKIDEIIDKFSTNLKKNGDIAKSYTLLDIKGAMISVEKYIKSLGMEDLSDALKVKNFESLMGYAGYVSGKEEDRPKLLVLNKYELKRKKDGKQFGYSIVTKSIGSGKESRFTVFNRVYDDEPIEKGDLIYCKNFSLDGVYYTLNSYDKIYC